MSNAGGTYTLALVLRLCIYCRAYIIRGLAIFRSFRKNPRECCTEELVVRIILLFYIPLFKYTLAQVWHLDGFNEFDLYLLCEK